jgi:hypothetical protein
MALPPSARSNGSYSFSVSRFPPLPAYGSSRDEARDQMRQTDQAKLADQP